MRTKNVLLKYEFTINSFEREAGSFIAKKNACVVSARLKMRSFDGKCRAAALQMATKINTFPKAAGRHITAFNALVTAYGVVELPSRSKYASEKWKQTAVVDRSPVESFTDEIFSVSLLMSLQISLLSDSLVYLSGDCEQLQIHGLVAALWRALIRSSWTWQKRRGV